ncbi:MAG: ABC transporter ATP-binding protein [Phycisphaerae bacterium]|jgi:oligopeptide/dipeptide ABC transporter ATP-binding protein|nr:ABC transporter ATP-binding protein [Phycisphaerae bacterium]
MSSNGTLLQVRDLRTYFSTEDGLVKAVDGVSFSIDSGETFAIVGESGCGKSVTAFSVMGIVPSPPGRVVGGSIHFEGANLLDYSEKQMRQVRGGQISMVFQEPMSSLNPVFTCGNQIVEAINLHQKVRGAEADQLAIEMLDKVGIPAPDQRFREYPHQMSGGMKQRVMIAMALSCNPKLLIADEPTTALDVTIQAQILDLVKDIQEDSDLAVLLITHDLAVVAETAHRVGVMYASKMVETTDVTSLFNDPLHPYTQGLFRSLPRLGTRTARLETIAGNVPNPLNFPTGCKFHPRCHVGNSLQRCQTEEPALKQVRPGHWCACWECPGYNDTPPPTPAGTDVSGD